MSLSQIHTIQRTKTEENTITYMWKILFSE